MIENDGLVWVQVEIRHVTDAAILVREGPRPAWLPMSKITDFEPIGHKQELSQFERGDHTKVEIPYWLCVAKGLDEDVVRN